MSGGVETPAILKALRPTGKTDVGGGKEHELTFDVKPPDGDSYAAITTQYMVDAQLSQLSEGMEVTVRVDPEDRESLMLWTWPQPP